MTKYELLSLIISIIALVAPAARWIYKNWIKKPILNYYPNGKVSLYFNKSGSYLRLDGVLEALNHSASVKKMEIIVKKDDNTTHKLPWSSFFSPVTQYFAGTPLFSNTSEIAHPFKIEGNSLFCVFTEFSDDSTFGVISMYLEALAKEALEISIHVTSYSEALERYKNLDLYNEIKTKISRKFYWDIGKYTFTLKVSCIAFEKEFSFTGEVKQSDYDKLSRYIDEVLLLPLMDLYKQQSHIKPVIIDIK